MRGVVQEWEAGPLRLALLRPAVVRSIMISDSNWSTDPKRVMTNLPWAEVVSINESLILLNFTPSDSNWSTNFNRCEMLLAILSSFQTITVPPSLSLDIIIKPRLWRSAFTPEETSR
jgi:hypothetical protein